jgi:hypothetical protein
LLEFVKKYLFNGLPEDASNPEGDRKAGVVPSILNRDDCCARYTNAFGQLCLRPFALGS